MHKVVVIGEIEDAAKWEKGFRTHGDLFKSQTVTNTSFQVTGDNKVVVCFEASDIDTYMKILDSPQTAEAMAHDGIKRETVQVHVLDKQFTP
jgi:hypothetical protein